MLLFTENELDWYSLGGGRLWLCFAMEKGALLAAEALKIRTNRMLFNCD